MKVSRLALTSLSAALIVLCAGPVHALGLGRLNVQSALGEGLNAEIDIASMTPEEASTLEVRIASPETYRAAGVEYHPALAATRVQMSRRPDGRPFIKLTGERPVVEPFVDVILELSWAAGRLVREYTLLLDQPRTGLAQNAPAPTPAVIAPLPPSMPQPVATAPAPVPQAIEPAPVEAPRARIPAAPQRAAAAAARGAAKPAPRTANSTSEIVVRPGDTLGKIARQVQPEGVSLDQMLVSMFRTNPDAFSGANMNRLRAGAILKVPDAASAQAEGQGEARSMILAQSADFNAYRRRLATNVAAAPKAPARQAGGKVQASVEDRQQADAKAADKLKLSKGAASASAPEAKISREAAEKEASTRVAELSRNLDDLKKVQNAKAVEAGTPAKPAASVASAPAVATAPAVAVPPTPVAEVKPEPAPVVASAPAVTPPPAPVVAEAPKPPAPAVPVEEGERGWFASLLESPYALPAGAGLAALLAGMGIMRVRARNRKAASETSFMESRMQPDSFFGASGGQRVDTHDGVAGTPADPASSSMTYSLSQLDAIGDVDPVAEADVYLAYGRDLQAEEILTEAMRSDPNRLAIRTKLLEVYAKRRDTKGFESLATQLFGITRGEGAEWKRAQELGLSIDEGNPLYAEGGRPEGDSTEGGIEQPLGSPATRVAVDDFQDIASRPATAQPAPEASDLDIDLSFDEPAAQPAAPSSWTAPAAAAAGAGAAAVASGFGSAAAEAKDSRAFQVSRVDLPLEGDDKMTVDLSDINLDLNKPGAAASAKADAVRAAAESRNSGFVDLSGLPDDPESQFNDDGDPLERKLELAEEFRDIGDLEGARDLLTEVVSSAEGALKQKAQTMLDSLG